VTFDGRLRAGAFDGRAAILLAHALTAAVAQRSGIRVLFIKGLTMTAQQLRTERVPADVDVWVDPARHAEFIATLEGFGWHRRPESRSWRLFITHSVTLICDGWPCDIDVHDRFPGAFAAPQAAFDRMWDARSLVRLESGVATVPSIHHHAVIGVLHALRSPSHDRSAADLAHLHSVVEGWSSADRELLAAAAVDLGAQEAVAEVFAHLGIRLELPPQPSPAMLEWNLRRTARDHSVDWILEVVHSPWRAKPGVIRAALFPSRTDVVADHPTSSGSATNRLRLRLRRYGRALSSLPDVLRAVRVARRTRRAGGVVPSPPAVTVTGDDAGTESLLAEATVPAAPVTDAPAGSPAGPTHDITAIAHVGADATAPDSPVQRSPHLAEVVVARTSYVLDLDRLDRPPVVLAGTAATIWVRLHGRTDAHRIADSIAGELGIDASEILGDVRSFVAELRGLGLVTPADAAAQPGAAG
jgi:hypothetical protein